MAVDGSFSLESELRRFLDRCPKLKSVPSFSNLLAKVLNICVKCLKKVSMQLLVKMNVTYLYLGVLG